MDTVTAGYKPQDRITEGHKTNREHNNTEEERKMATEKGCMESPHVPETNRAGEVRTGCDVTFRCIRATSVAVEKHYYIL